MIRVKSGIFGQIIKFGQRPCFIQILIIRMKRKLTKQTVKILMRRLFKNRHIFIFTVCKCMPEFTWCPKSPYPKELHLNILLYLLNFKWELPQWVGWCIILLLSPGKRHMLIRLLKCADPENLSEGANSALTLF